jgi:ADP-ribosyl-[dinitrogen reductase] hydrolase
MGDISTRDRFRGCLLGLACGDAVGTTLEFKPRGSFTPITDMVGGGPFGLEPGQWTDDTSMALCLAHSLLDRDGFDAQDQMTRYLDWYQNGYLSSTGKCFDIGNATRRALERFAATQNPFAGSRDPGTAGNGSLMRLAPIPMFYFNDAPALVRCAGDSSRTTHGAAEAIECCHLFARMLADALAGRSRDRILIGEKAVYEQSNVQAIARGDYRRKPESQIVGSGYCIASLEAALWCFLHTDSFGTAVLAAANLGDDADTTAAITGQIAGAFYGAKSIPVVWRARLAMGDDIDALAQRLYDRAT